MARAKAEMEQCIKLFLIITCVFRCNGVSWRRQLEHIAHARVQSNGLTNNNIASRRFYQFDPREMSTILGVPARASHLPEAEPVLPGHTLLKPSLGMLKSAVKFPHKELEDGAGVYGNIDSLGIRYDGRNERTLYSGFRRSPSDYIMVIPSKIKDKYEKKRYKLESAVMNLERKENVKNELLKILKRLNVPLKGVKVFVGTLDRDGLQYNFLEHKENILRNTQEKNISDRSSSSKEKNVNSNEQHIPQDSNEYQKIKKFEWFLQSKNSYDHIKVNQDAPELNELIPVENDEKIREWWFYNAEDYKPLES